MRNLNNLIDEIITLFPNYEIDNIHINPKYITKIRETHLGKYISFSLHESILSRENYFTLVLLGTKYTFPKNQLFLKFSIPKFTILKDDVKGREGKNFYSEYLKVKFNNALQDILE